MSTATLTNGASSHSLLDLPSELRALVDYLDNDDRPTFILEKHQTAHKDNRDRGILYCNSACKLPVSGGGKEWKQVLEDLVDFDLHHANGQKEHVALLEGKKWDVRKVGDGWTVLVGRDDSLENGVLFDTASVLSVETRDTQDQSEGMQDGAWDPEDGDGVPNENSVNSSLDWTRHPVMGLSSWIEFVRNFNWSATSVGPMESWPTRLRNLVYSMMANPDPRLMVWGESKSFIYNEACSLLFGRMHPSCMGRPLSEGWPDVWPQLAPLVLDAYKGKAARLEALPLVMERNGFIEETYWDFTMLPLIGTRGHAIGVLCELKEMTRAVTGERRRASVTRVASQIASVSSLKELWSTYLEGLEPAEEDIRFALLYAVEEESSEATSDYVSRAGTGSLDVCSPHAFNTKCVLQGTVGISTENPCFLNTFSLTEDREDPSPLLKSYLEACRTRKPVTIRTSDGSLPACLASTAPSRGFGDDVRCAVIQPIVSVMAEHEVLGLLVLGLSPRSRFDEEYNLYVNFIAEVLQKGAAFISLPQEQRRAQKIADDINNALAQQLRMTTLAAEHSEAKFARMAASAPIGMYLFNTEGRPLYVNDAYLKMNNETRESYFQNYSQFDKRPDHVHDDDKAKFDAAWETVVNERTPVTVEYRLKKSFTSVDKATGKKIEGQTWLLATAFPDIDHDGRVMSIQGWLTDISHQKFSEQLLSQKLADAIENKRQTENFIDMTSHEMRNPLSAILQSADSIVHTLEQEGVPLLDQSTNIPHSTADEIVDAAQTIILCAQHQKRIVDDILTLSKLDASLLVISPDKVQPPMLVTKALKMYEAEITRANIHAKLCIEQSYVDMDIDWVILDASRLLQVVINMLTNAIKFTQSSEERIVTVCLGASKNKPTGKHHNIDYISHKHEVRAKNPLDEWLDCEDIYIQIAVTDTGPGLSEEEMKQLFQRFSQASPKTYKQYGGSGLGLFISRELCELQGGQIGVRSGKGETTFAFYVRAKKWQPENTSDQQKPQRPQPSRYVSNSSSPMAFNRRGSIVISEPNRGLQPLSRQSSRISRPEDSPTIHESAAEENRPPPRFPSRHPPSRSVSRPPSRASTWPARKPAPPEALHVLVVEDNLINQKVMSQQLRKAGCTVHVANHGLECLDFLDKSAFCSNDTPLSLILLDLEMPTMDGLTCIRHIRERQTLGKIIKHVPVIAVTANARSEQISIAIDAGMDSVVTKPIRVFELMPQMESLVAEIALKWAEKENDKEMDGG